MTRQVSRAKYIGVGVIQRNEKSCDTCHKPFIPTGANCKRCPACRRIRHVEYCKERWHSTYIKKGYNQKGSSNNAWKGGSSPAYYRRKATEEYGTMCVRCSAPAVLVHHKNGNKRDSSAQNLEVLCKRCHQLQHTCANNLPKKVVFKRRECARCDSTFKPTGPRGHLCPSCRRARAKV